MIKMTKRGIKSRLINTLGGVNKVKYQLRA